MSYFNLRLIHISDFHFTRMTWNPLRLFSKRLFGISNWYWNRKSDFSEEILAPLPELFRSLKADLILLGGDLSTTALKEEFAAAASFVKKLGLPWIAIPGNHDSYTKASYKRKDFYRFFPNKRKEISHPVEFFTLQDHGIEAHPISEGSWIVALDTTFAASFASSQGHFSEKGEAYLEEVLKLIPQTDSIVLLNHFPFFQNDEPHRNLIRGEVLEKRIKEDPRIRMYLHGHTHRQTIANLKANRLPVVLDSGSCTFKKQASWNLIDLDSQGCSVSAYRWNGQWEERQTDRFSWK